MAKLWGSRFSRATGKLTDKFTSSISYDYRLARYDCLGSIAHARMLAKQKIISGRDCVKIINGLKSILKDVEGGKFRHDPGAEDIHSNIQHVLKKKIGEPADRLHTARSRNDQVALDVKLYIMDMVSGIIKLASGLQKSIIGFAEKDGHTVIPAYTHLQSAQAVLLSHHLFAYLEMLERDKERLADSMKRTDFLPLGACALSGTSLPIDRAYVAKQLGFSGITANSIDSVSDRDFILELLGCLTILSVHLSRISEDLILWSTSEFNFIDLDWSFCTGSSIMPHKKNPDVLELVRGAVGKILGDFSSVTVMMKGLPLSYNRDMQLDKPALFDAVDSVNDVLSIYSELFKNIKLNRPAIAKSLESEALFSVDLVEYLIKKGLSYRKSHDIVGRIVRDVLDKGRSIKSLSGKELMVFSEKLKPDCLKLLNAAFSVSLKKSYGGTSPDGVRKQLRRWRKKLNA